MPEDRHPNSFLVRSVIQSLVEVDRKKPWGRVVDDLFVALGIDKGEYLHVHEVEGRERSAASFMASVEECICERECKLYDDWCGFTPGPEEALILCAVDATIVTVHASLGHSSSSPGSCLDQTRSRTHLPATAFRTVINF